jgi:predicted nuclease of predicted toxin-antitoxin system
VNYLTDENISRRFVSAVLRTIPGVDIVRIQDVGLQGQPDDVLLAWAAAQNRVLITQDRATIPPLVAQRMDAQLVVPLVVIIRPRVTFADVLQAVHDLEHDGLEHNWAYPVRWIP